MFALGVSFLLIVLSSREELGLGHNVAATADATLVGTSGASSFNSILEDDIQFLFKWPGESLLHLENVIPTDKSRPYFRLVLFSNIYDLKLRI